MWTEGKKVKSGKRASEEISTAAPEWILGVSCIVHEWSVEECRGAAIPIFLTMWFKELFFYSPFLAWPCVFLLPWKGKDQVCFACRQFIFKECVRVLGEHLSEPKPANNLRGTKQQHCAEFNMMGLLLTSLGDFYATIILCNRHSQQIGCSLQIQVFLCKRLYCYFI